MKYTVFCHPVHLHLANFQILERNGKPPLTYETGWKDTVALTAGDEVRVIARFGGYRGRYLLHCHNLEHEDRAGWHALMSSNAKRRTPRILSCCDTRPLPECGQGTADRRGYVMSFDYELDFVRRRYDRLASIYPLFNLMFWLPSNIRARAVKRLELRPGDKVLEVGCGTGRNLRWLVEAIGPTGEVFGVDCCNSMLAKARALSERHQWHNVKLWQQDASEVLLPVQVDGVLFSLAYTVIPKPVTVLERTWDYLRRTRHVVIMDGKLARGRLGTLSRPVVTFLSKATVLGDPDRQPWEDLKKFTSQVEMEEVNFGTYYICRGTKQ